MSKGLVVEYILEEVQNAFGRRAGMIFCIGDDIADESMFEAVLEYESEKLKRNRNDIKRVFTCCVGKKPSRSEYYVNNVDDVQNLLRDLIQGNSLG